MTDCKSLKLKALYEEYQAKTDEYFTETLPHQFVWGFGSPDSKVILIGEAPGKDEVIQGRPFVGKAGQMLTDFLNGAGLNREDLFITNTMKYRLSREGVRPGTLANRPAKRNEILFSCEYLKREIEIIEPKAVVTLGNVPLKAMLLALELEKNHQGKKLSFSALPEIGKVHGIAFEKQIGAVDFILFPMYHPASVIYNRMLEQEYKKDLKKIFSQISIFFEKRC